MPMKPSPELRPTVWDGLVVLAVVLLAAGLAFFQWRSGSAQDGPLTAVVSIDGEEIDRFLPEDLLKSPRTYTGNGYTLTLAFSVDYEGPALNALPPSGKSGLCVAVSDCPTQDCVHTGIITRSGQSIVCLPARLIIRLEGGAAEDGGVDAVLG